MMQKICRRTKRALRTEKKTEVKSSTGKYGSRLYKTEKITISEPGGRLKESIHNLE